MYIPTELLFGGKKAYPGKAIIDRCLLKVDDLLVFERQRLVSWQGFLDASH